MAENFDTNEEPILARPVYPAGQSFSPPTLTPLAQLTTSYAPRALPAPPVGFPSTNLSRSAAAVDLIVILIAAVIVGLGGGTIVLTKQLLRVFPSLEVLASNIVIGLVMLSIVAALMFLRRQSPATIGLGRAPILRTSLWTIAAVPLNFASVIIVVSLYMVLAGVDIDKLTAERQEFFEMIPDMSKSSALLMAFFAGLHEEILFRGFILSRCRTMLGSNAAAILVSGLLFGLVHIYQGTVGVVQTATVGVVLGVVATYARSLWPVIIAHGTIDTIALIAIPWFRDYLSEFMKQSTSAPADTLH